MHNPVEGTTRRQEFYALLPTECDDGIYRWLCRLVREQFYAHRRWITFSVRPQ